MAASVGADSLWSRRPSLPSTTREPVLMDALANEYPLTFALWKRAEGDCLLPPPRCIVAANFPLLPCSFPFDALCDRSDRDTQRNTNCCSSKSRSRRLSWPLVFIVLTLSPRQTAIRIHGMGDQSRIFRVNVRFSEEHRILRYIKSMLFN